MEVEEELPGGPWYRVWMASPVILGLLQNMWVRDPAAARRLIERHGARGRRAMIRTFMPRTASGRALRRAFGSLFERITWENAASVVAGRSDAAPPADHLHLRRIVEELQPDVVVAFGRIAVDACRAAKLSPLIEARHPSPRSAGRTALPALTAAASELREFVAGDSG